MYHGLSSVTEDPSRSLSPRVSVELLQSQLRHARKAYEVVPPRNLLEQIGRRSPRERIPVALTFDDDLRSHYELAAPILSAMNLPATFFLTGASLEDTATFWPHELEAAFRQGDGVVQRLLDKAKPLRGVSTSAGLHEIARRIVLMPPAERDAVAEVLKGLVPQNARDPGLQTEMVRHLDMNGFEIGFHTRRHYSLPTLDDAQLQVALREGYDDLSSITKVPPSAIAYPHGAATDRIAAAAHGAGFRLGFTYTGAAVTFATCPLLIDRVDAATPSLQSFILKLARASNAVTSR